MSISSIKGKSFKPLKNTVFVRDIESGIRKTMGGIVLLDDNMKDSGVHPRWAQVYAVGPDVDDLKPGEWILIKHARWTLGIDLELEDESVRVWRVEYPESVELVSETDPRNALPANLQIVR